MGYKKIEVTPSAGACGAEIRGVDLCEDLDEQRIGEVRRAFHENLVIFFRDQDMTENQHKAFGARFGELNIHPRYVPLEGHPEIFPIRKDPEHTKIVGGSWHQDLTHLETQPLGSILYALDVPPVGGDVVEVYPPLDPTGNTALVGATMMFEILCLLAEARTNR